MPIELPDLEFDLDGTKYKWNWKYWIDLKHFTEPPTIIISNLNLILTEYIKNEEVDLSHLDLTDLTALASNFKDAGANGLSFYILDNIILDQIPNDPSALSVLCSLLRKTGRPREALDRTKNYSYKNASLLTSRAAAMCDLELWEEAKHEVGVALAICNNQEKQEAFNVVRRIRSNRPDLYKS